MMMIERVKEEAERIAKNSEKILTFTEDEKRIFATIKELGQKIYIKNSATIEDVEIITSRALALLVLMRHKTK